MHPKILMVENERRLRQFYKLELEAEGYEVITAANGQDALAKLREAPVQVVVFDLAFSDEAGMACLQNLVNTNRDLKVMIHTADPMYRMDFRTWVADALLMKSPDAGKLKSAVGRLWEAQTIRLSKNTSCCQPGN